MPWFRFCFLSNFGKNFVYLKFFKFWIKKKFQARFCSDSSKGNVVVFGIADPLFNGSSFVFQTGTHGFGSFLFFFQKKSKFSFFSQKKQIFENFHWFFEFFFQMDVVIVDVDCGSIFISEPLPSIPEPYRSRLIHSLTLVGFIIFPHFN